jgi:hypothetical protein
MPPRLLFKYPTRGRVERFFEGLDSIVNNLYDKENFEIQVTADADDPTMASQEVFERIKSYPNTYVLYGKSTSKVSAVNRDISTFKPFDIICCHSDDMRWTFYGFDEIIRQQFLDGDFDKLLHVPDSDAKQYLATYYIAGKTFFDRFGFIYDPRFKSLFCDNLVMDIAMKLGKYRFVDCGGMLFHEHPSYGHTAFDPQYKEQQALWGEDEATYNQIKLTNYWL